MSKKIVVVFAGANGSGKSSLIAKYWLNKDIQYICPDHLLNPNIPDINERYNDAMNRAEELRKKLVAKGETFVFETVFSIQNKLDFLIECKTKGYYIHTIYVTTAYPEINIVRVKERVAHGGHNVETEKIISRYYRSMGFLKDIIRVSDEIQVFDNSLKTPFCVFIKNGNTMILLNKERRNKWVYEYIEKHFLGKVLADLTVEESKNINEQPFCCFTLETTKTIPSQIATPVLSHLFDSLAKHLIEEESKV